MGFFLIVAGASVLRGAWRRHRLIAAELGDQLPVGVEIGEHDDLADFRILISATAGRREAAPPAGATADRKAQVALAEIAFGERLFLGRASVDQRQRYVGLAFLDVDAAGDRANGACP